jgi:hypothetical protein
MVVFLVDIAATSGVSRRSNLSLYGMKRSIISRRSKLDHPHRGHSVGCQIDNAVGICRGRPSTRPLHGTPAAGDPRCHTVTDLESRLTDAVLDMADKLISGVFAKARNATRQHYVASAADMGRL